MSKLQNVRKSDYTQYLAGGGCLLSVPVFLGLGFKFMLNYAKSKEHQFSHQVEEVELEGDAAAMLDDGLPPQEALQRLVKKLERITEQYSKMGASFSVSDFAAEKGRLDSLKERLGAEASQAENSTLLARAQQLLQQYAPAKT